MDHPGKDEVRTLSPRPLRDDERQVLLGWLKAARDFSAFVSERRTDDPAIYRRIVVSRRTTKQHLYLIHAPANSTGWILVSAVDDGVERFPTLRAALNQIAPVNYPATVAESSRADRNRAAQRVQPRKGALAVGRLGLIFWLCALAGTVAISRWLGLGGTFEQGSRSAEAIAEQAVQDGLGGPDSAQFRNVIGYKIGPDNERWVCGWYYARNAAGEFAGPRRFVVHVLLAARGSPDGDAGIGTHWLRSETEVPSMSYAWEHYCR